MTIEELNIAISVAADDALAALDTVTEKLQALGNETTQKGMEKAFDPKPMETFGKVAETVMENAASATKKATEDVVKELAKGESASWPFVDGIFAQATEAIQTGITNVCQALQSPEVAEAVGTLQNALSQAKEGLFTEEDVAAVTEAWNTVFGEDGPLLASLGAFADAGMEGLGTAFLSMGLGLDSLTGSAEEAAGRLLSTSKAAQENRAGVEELSKSFDWLNASTEQASARAKSLLSAYNNQRTALTKCAREVKTLDAAQAALNKAKKSGTKLTQDEQAALKKAAALVGYTGESYDELQAGITKYAQKLRTDIVTALGNLQSLSGEMSHAADCSNIDGSVQVDISGAMGNLTTLISQALEALGILQALGVAKNGGGGGGGSDYDAAAAARAAEQARQDRIRQDYDYIEHKRHMNEITLEEELAMLRRIRDNHRLNAEEIMEWEEKIYDLKQEIRQRDAQSIDQLADGVVDALTARYEAMRDAELSRLDASRKAWESWRDDSVRAIEEQIDALDKLSDTENREAKDAEELRKMEKLRREIAYEQDEYNRLKLQQQLDAAIQSREERLRKLAIEDQKDALRGEIDRVEQRADAEISALDEEQAELEKAYDERMKSASLQAEAEKLVMRKSQTELLKLLRDYAPEYDALGQTLGEKLFSGFSRRVGSVAEWFEGFNRQLAQMQNAIAQTAVAGADAFYGGYEGRQSASAAQEAANVTVHQTVNFNEPVDSPSATARRLQDANAALGELLLN